MRARIDQAARDADLLARLLQATFQHQVGAKLTPRLVRSFNALRDQVSRRNQLQMAVVTHLHEFGGNRLAQSHSQRIC